MAGQAPTTVRRFVLPALFLGILFAALWWRRPATPPLAESQEVSLPVVKVTGPTMGTTWHATVVGTDQPGDIQKIVQDELDAVNGSMSTWLEDSELSQLNRGDGALVELSHALAEVLAISLEVGAASGGAFDVTIGPVVDAWGFGPQDPAAAPTDDQLAALLAHVGPDTLVFDPTARTLAKTSPAVRIDLSAVAKGYGSDQALAALVAAGHTNAMVEVGGEVATIGHNDQGQPWRIGVEVPDGTGSVLQPVPISGRAMATSGDYRNYRELDGKRVSHTIDPRTGRPISHGLASVSVVHDDCAHADAWATALNVLGPVDGPRVAQSNGIAALFVTRQGDSFVTTATPTWPGEQPGDPSPPESP